MKQTHQSVHDAIMAEYEAEKAKKEAAKATMPQKARTYKKIIHASFTIVCFATIASMIIIFVRVLSEQSLFTPILIGVGAITTLSTLTFFTAIIAKKIWEHQLLKLGLMLPPELE